MFVPGILACVPHGVPCRVPWETCNNRHHLQSPEPSRDIPGLTSCSLNLIAPLLLVSGVRLRLGLGDVCPHSVLALQLAVSPILGFGFALAALLWLALLQLIGIALGSAVESTGSGSSSRLDLLMASSSLSSSLGEARDQLEDP